MGSFGALTSVWFVFSGFIEKNQLRGIQKKTRVSKKKKVVAPL